MITLETRVARLESAVSQLCGILQRMGTEQDGNWGYKPTNTQLGLLQQYVEGKLDSL